MAEAGSRVQTLDDALFRASFIGINGVLSAYDMGKLDFLVKAYSLIEGLPYDQRFTQSITDQVDQWSPLACVKIVQLQRMLAIPMPEDGGVSHCLTNIQSFENKFGVLGTQAASAYDKAMRALPGATAAEKLANLRLFYANFGGPGANLDTKVSTALAILNLYRDFRSSAAAGPDVNSLMNALQQHQDLILRYASLLADQQGYINGTAYDTFFREINRNDLRTVFVKILNQSNLPAALQAGALNFYDGNTGAIDVQLFSAVYSAGLTSYTQIMDMLGVRTSAQPAGKYLPAYNGGRVLLSELVGLWNDVYNGHSANPYRDIFQLLPRGVASSGEDVDIRKRVPAIMKRLSFPRGLPARKLVNAVQNRVLPLDLVVGVAAGGSVIVIE